MAGTVAKFELDYEQVNQLRTAIKSYGDGAEDAIHAYLVSKGSDIIETNIQGLIHPSGRKWKGKPGSATTASKKRVFGLKDGSVPTEIIIKLLSRYVYLIYPDLKQGFLQDAVDKSTDRILKDLIDILGKEK